jgi:hypothetical protein
MHVTPQFHVVYDEGFMSLLPLPGQEHQHIMKCLLLKASWTQNSQMTPPSISLTISGTITNPILSCTKTLESHTELHHAQSACCISLQGNRIGPYSQIFDTKSETVNYINF